MISFLGLGSNIDDKLTNLHEAIELITKDQNIRLLKLSSFYESPPMYNHELNNFFNGVVKIDTSYSPIELLKIVKNIEHVMGRKDTRERYSNRPIDIDILCCGLEIIETSKLVVPHPHIKERKFVLKPWSDIDSDYIMLVKIEKLRNYLS